MRVLDQGVATSPIPAVHHRSFKALLVGVGFVMLLSWLQGDRVVSSSAWSQVSIGVTFSPRFARALGLRPMSIYRSTLEDLGVRNVRLPVYWDEVEPQPGQFDFSALDEYVRQAESRSAAVIPAVGYKAPRWPECYAPPWAEYLTTEQTRERILRMIGQTVRHLRGYQSIAQWQVENEPFQQFGECRNSEILSPEFVAQEIDLVRAIDPRPVLLTDSGELSPWLTALRLPADHFGTTLYRQWEVPVIGLWHTPLPAWSYAAKDWMTRQVVRQSGETFLIELQAEPWFRTTPVLVDAPVHIQRELFPPEGILMDNVDFARRTSFRQIYLWGVEWWYWMREQGYPEYVDTARAIFWESSHAVN